MWDQFMMDGSQLKFPIYPTFSGRLLEFFFFEPSLSFILITLRYQEAMCTMTNPGGSLMSS